MMAVKALPRIALLVLAAAVLAAGVAVSVTASGALHVGLTRESNSGRVLAVDPGSIAASIGIHAGDVVTAVGGVPVGTDPTVVGGELPVSLRLGRLLAVRWAAVPRDEGFWPGSLLLLVAATFWLAGAFATVRGGPAAARVWFALFAYLMALALVAPLAVDRALPIVGWLLPPAAFGAAVSYLWLQRALEVEHLAPRDEYVRLLLSGLAMLVALAIEAGPALAGGGAGRPLAVIGGADLLLIVIVAHLPAFTSMRGDRPAPVRRRLRLALLVGAAAWLPALILGWVPLMTALLGLGYTSPVSVSAGAISLLAIAATYPVILVRGDLYTLESIVRRLAAAACAAAILAAAAIGVLHVVDLSASPSSDGRLAIALLLLVVTLPLFDPLRMRLQHLLDRRLDSLDPAYAGSLEALGDRLLQAFDEAGIGEALTGILPERLGLARAAVWLRASDRRWLYYSSDPVSSPAPRTGRSGRAFRPDRRRRRSSGRRCAAGSTARPEHAVYPIARDGIDMGGAMCSRVSGPGGASPAVAGS